MNIISNLIFHCNNCDANRAFVTIRESTAAAQSSSLLNAKFTLKGTSHTNHFRMNSKVNEWPTTSSQTVFTQRNFVADFLQAKCDFRRKSAVLPLIPVRHRKGPPSQKAEKTVPMVMYNWIRLPLVPIAVVFRSSLTICRTHRLVGTYTLVTNQLTKSLCQYMSQPPFTDWNIAGIYSKNKML